MTANSPAIMGEVVPDKQVEAFTEWSVENRVDGAAEQLREEAAEKLPHVILPSDDVTISNCAEDLFKLIGPSHRLFARGGAVVTLVKRDDGMLALDILRPAAARSFFEKHARLFAWRTGQKGEPVLKPVTCAHDMAEALLLSQEAAKYLPRVQGLINCPVLRNVGGELVAAGPGYDEATRLLITGGKLPPVVELAEAVAALSALYDDFDFQTTGDRARAIASLISPALRMGGFLKGRVPADVAEADQSQSGKTYRQKIIAAVYNEQVSLVTNRQGGVGSVDESLNQQLVAGRPFIQFDNFRGRFESAHLEAFLTADGTFSCRVPHRGDVGVSPENFFIFLTSNGVNTSRDFANRSNIIRIRKKPAGHQFQKFEEGDLLNRVRHWQAYYLGCVFAVVRAWHAQGQPRTDETRHDFREWAQVVDWMMQKIFSTVPVMEGHRQAQERVSNPALVWLRSVVLAVHETGELDCALTATDIFGLCDNEDIAVPGLRPDADEDKGKKVIGTIMAKLFREHDTLDVDGFSVTREERYLPRDDACDGGSFKSKTYTVTKL
jgi:hypothetical protein